MDGPEKDFFFAFLDFFKIAFKTLFARSLFDKKKWYFHQIFQLWLGWKVQFFFVKQRLRKHCFKNEWTLVLLQRY